MHIRLTKRGDGGVVLRCERADGSCVWQRQGASHARFFAAHDLTHYAIETTLGLAHGFFGLLADGWTFDDFGQPGQRGPLPAEGLAAEFLAGCFDQERATGDEWAAAQLNELGRSHLRDAGYDESAWPVLDEGRLARVRQARDELFARWGALAPDEHLDLEWPASDRAG